ncbi:Vacuolar-sorting protein SNF7 [Peltigera leucophlebia]|nr:Vacuolar-sorting protein SNF7 [Peltigera leucophlebia]
MSGLEKSLFNLKAVQQGHQDIARIYAQNAIRKQNEKLNLLRLQSRIDAVASRVQTAVTMRQVTGSMAGVVRGMEGAMKAMDVEKISAVMDKFESQFEDLDVATGYYETATSSATAVGTPQDEVDRLIHLVADEAGIELKEEMKSPEQAALTKNNVDEEEREGALGERLRALRN